MLYLSKMKNISINKEKYDKIIKKLQESSIGIAGLGGLGSNIAISLTRAGVGHLILIDYDKVEKSNINRQYYFLDQIGNFKTNALKKTIKKINPKMQVNTKNIKLKKGSMHSPFKNVDLIIEALDDAQTKTDFIEEILLKLPKKPIIAASGVAGYGNSDRISTKKFSNLYVVYDKQAQPCEKDTIIAPRVALIANWQANIAIEIILNGEK